MTWVFIHLIWKIGRAARAQEGLRVAGVATATWRELTLLKCDESINCCFDLFCWIYDLSLHFFIGLLRMIKYKVWWINRYFTLIHQSWWNHVGLMLPWYSQASNGIHAVMLSLEVTQQCPVSLYFCHSRPSRPCSSTTSTSFWDSVCTFLPVNGK